MERIADGVDTETKIHKYNGINRCARASPDT